MDNKNIKKKKYNIKINSIDRNLIKEPNPFNFRINFNKNNNNEFCINSNYKNIKKITVTELVIPSRIYDNIIGTKFDGLFLHKTDTNKVILTKHNTKYELKYDNNTITIKCGTYSKILKTSFNLMDNETSNLLMINNIPYTITAINNMELTLDRQVDVDVSNLVLGDINTNYLINDTVAINSSNNIYTFTFNKNIKYFTNILYTNAILIGKIVNDYFIIKVNNHNNTTMEATLLYGNLVNGNYSIDFHMIMLNTNYTLDDKCFFLKFKELKQSKETSDNININNSLGIFHPVSTSCEHALLSGNCELEFDNRQQFTTLSFELMDETGNSIGDNYKLLPYNMLNDKYNQVIINMVIET